MPPSTIIEIAAASAGILGSLLLALNGARAGWGFVAFLASNACWIAFALLHDYSAMLVQQLAFSASSMLGIWVWLVRPALQRRRTQQDKATSI